MAGESDSAEPSLAAACVRRHSSRIEVKRVEDEYWLHHNFPSTAVLCSLLQDKRTSSGHSANALRGMMTPQPHDGSSSTTTTSTEIKSRKNGNDSGSSVKPSDGRGNRQRTKSGKYMKTAGRTPSAAVTDEQRSQPVLHRHGHERLDSGHPSILVSVHTATDSAGLSGTAPGHELAIPPSPAENNVSPMASSPVDDDDDDDCPGNGFYLAVGSPAAGGCVGGGGGAGVGAGRMATAPAMQRPSLRQLAAQTGLNGHLPFHAADSDNIATISGGGAGGCDSLAANSRADPLASAFGGYAAAEDGFGLPISPHCHVDFSPSPSPPIGNPWESVSASRHSHGIRDDLLAQSAEWDPSPDGYVRELANGDDADSAMILQSPRRSNSDAGSSLLIMPSDSDGDDDDDDDDEHYRSMPALMPLVRSKPIPAISQPSDATRTHPVPSQSVTTDTSSAHSQPQQPAKSKLRNKRRQRRRSPTPSPALANSDPINGHRHPIGRAKKARLSTEITAMDQDIFLADNRATSGRMRRMASKNASAFINALSTPASKATKKQSSSKSGSDWSSQWEPLPTEPEDFLADSDDDVTNLSVISLQHDDDHDDADEANTPGELSSSVPNSPSKYFNPVVRVTRLHPVVPMRPLASPSASRRNANGQDCTVDHGRTDGDVSIPPDTEGWQRRGRPMRQAQQVAMAMMALQGERHTVAVSPSFGGGTSDMSLSLQRALQLSRNDQQQQGSDRSSSSSAVSTRISSPVDEPQRHRTFRPRPPSRAQMQLRMAALPKLASTNGWSADTVQHAETDVGSGNVRYSFLNLLHSKRDPVSVGSNVMISGGRRKPPFVARVLAITQEEDEEVQLQLAWYYRPCDIPSMHDAADWNPNELLSSEHADTNSASCLIGRCHVTSVAHYCRYRAARKRQTLGVDRHRSTGHLVPPLSHALANPTKDLDGTVPPKTPAAQVFFCSQSYDQRSERVRQRRDIDNRISTGSTGSGRRR